MKATHAAECMRQGDCHTPHIPMDLHLQVNYALGKSEVGQVAGCGQIQRYRYDVVILEPFELLIELDGGQHFKPVMFGRQTWSEAVENLVEGVMRDRCKDNYAAYRHIPLLRIGPDVKLVQPMLQYWVNPAKVEQLVYAERWLTTRFATGCQLLSCSNLSSLKASFMKQQDDVTL